MTRKLLVIALVTPFVVLCVYDLLHGRYRTGILAGLFAICNAMIYW